ncbi:MAG: hypothetical protein WAL58_10100 [Terriglobales bacterium]
MDLELRSKLLRYLGLFCLLTVLDAIYFHGFLAALRGSGEVIEVGDLMRPLIKFCVISALPFAVLAYSDDNWRSADAAPLCLTAWPAVFGAYSVKYGAQCPMSALFPFFPLVLSALLAHALGTFCKKLVLMKST